MKVFNRETKLIQRNRSATDPDFKWGQYLKDEVSKKTIERLSYLKVPFDNVLDFGAHSGNFERTLCEERWDERDPTWKEDRLIVKNKIGKILMVDSSEGLLFKDMESRFNKELQVDRLVADEEHFDAPELTEENKYDLIISNLALHWINDLPQAFKNLHKCLKPDGCFIGSMFGGDTLFELRTSLQLAEMERYGGIAPRVSPFVNSADVGNLMQKAGFTMLTVDVQEFIVDYPNTLALMEDLKLMGENNSVLMTPPTLTKDLLIALEPIYQELHGNKETGHLPATFRFVYMIGWKQGKYMARPAPRGSADISLKDAFESGIITSTTTLTEDKDPNDDKDNNKK